MFMSEVSPSVLKYIVRYWFPLPFLLTLECLSAAIFSLALKVNIFYGDQTSELRSFSRSIILWEGGNYI